MLSRPTNDLVYPGNPQGIVFALAGSRCYNPNTGRRYVKLPPPDGTNPTTNTGWYRETHPMLDAYFSNQARGSTALLAVSGVLNNAMTAVTGTWLGMSNQNPVSFWALGAPALAGRTNGAANSTAALGFGTNGMPAGDTNAGASGLHDLDVDYAVDVMFGLDIPEGTATTLANARWWIIIGQGTGGAYSAPSNSAVMKTAFSGFVSAGSSCWGFRYSPPDGDTGFVPMAADGVGVTSGTAIGGAPALKIPIRFRVRVVHLDPNNGGVNTSYFSINDGAETKITGNMALAGGAMLQPEIAIYQTAIDAPGKAIGYIRHLLIAGALY